MGSQPAIQRQCPDCKSWISSEDRECIHCGYSFDPKIREQQRRERLKASGDKFKIWVDHLQHSNKFHMKVAYAAFRLVWFMYVAMLTLIIYFVALFSG